jgi:carbonic anhydrase
MSCSNATAPIDISKDNVLGKCDLKCEFSYHYNDSSCVATNRGDYISLTYDTSTTPPVTYNSSSYDVKEIRIYSPSLHSFNGTKADGEFIIIHNTYAGANPLLVCIPIKTSNTGEPSSKYLSSIIRTVANNAPTTDEQTTVNISNFNLNAFVPKKPFFSYTGTEPYQPCNEAKNEYIVFASETAIGIPDIMLNALKKVIAENVYDIKPSPGLFFNEKGPSNKFSSSQIYIDCQPVGESEEEEVIVTGSDSSSSSSTETLTTENIMDNTYFQMFLGALVFVAIIFSIQFLVTALKPTSGGGAAAKNVLQGGKIGGKFM